jgi:release factor glutamine methyltransferase
VPTDHVTDDARPVVDRLRAAGCVFAEDEAALLIEEADSSDRLEHLLVRRVSGEPLEHVLGWASFRGLRIRVGPGVFVPRLRTAYLVDLALDLLPAPGVLVDLCCGSGAIATVVLARRPDAVVHAADLDPAAVASARENVEPLGGQVHAGDLYDALPPALRGRVHVLAVNAPYVPTDAIATMPPEARDHEARIALDGGGDGLDVHRRVVAAATEWLTPGGHLLIETSVSQAPVAAALFAAHGLDPRVERSADHDATIVVGLASSREVR